ncbi:sensor histidine kinase [Chengkuizengella sp. SCS-71B]|uniref:sensor histidine kinase n=1 Tax=Chengkuizengella sp. SCS-71B TaxID=3115290 RepID=UPI0032C22E32
MKRNFLYRSLFFLFLIIQIWFLYLIIQYPNYSIFVSESEENIWSVYRIDSFTNELGLQIGDTILEIDHIAVNNYFISNNNEVLVDFKTILISRNDTELQIEVNTTSLLDIFDTLLLVSFILCYFIAFILYKNITNSPSAKMLSVIFMSLALIFISLGASSRGDILGKIINYSLLMLIPILFLHFLIKLFNEKTAIELSNRLLKYLYIFVFITFTVQFLSFPFFFTIDTTLNISRTTTMLIFLFGILANFTLLTIIYFKHKKEKTYTSTLIKTIWISLFISVFPFSFFSFLPDLLYGEQWISTTYTCWFGLLFPISFAYLLLSKKLYDIDILIRRYLFTIIISIIPSGIIVFSNELTYVNSLLSSHYIVSFIITTFILSLLLYSFEYLTTKFQRIIFPKRYHLNNALKKISQNLRSISSFHELKDITLVDIVNTMNVFGGAIIFKYNDSIETISEGDIDLNKATKMIETNEVDHDYICFEITDHEEYTSYLVLTKKKTNTVIGMEESQWINLIITYLAVNLENLYLIRKLTMKLEQLAVHIPDEKTANEFLWFRKFMFELQEKERVRIATDLHDTTMQDLFFLKRRLNCLIENKDLNHKHANEIKNIVSYVEIINVNLRQSCFELHPYLLQEAGLIHAIRKLIQLESAMNTFEIEFSVEDEYQIEERNMDFKSHIFRMIQEMITNTKKHAQATKVNISLQTMNHEIQLQFEDNGIGFNEQSNKEQDTLKSGMGMEQIKSRVLYLNGKLKVESSIGKGAKFWITLPNKEEKSA